MRAGDFDDRTARLSARDPGRDDKARDDRERRGNSGQNATPDGRRSTTSPGRKDDSLPDIKPRPSKAGQSKSKRDDDGDWPSTEWDKLSDVDYWAELAADKPFTAAVSAATTPGRSDRDRTEARSEADSAPIRAADRRESSDRRDSLHRRERDKTERRDNGDRRESADRRDSAARRDQLLPAARATRPTVDAAFTPPVSNGTDSYGSTELRRAIASGRTSTSGPHRVPHPTDDDPLTSPSFPRISADDSRSYRRSGGRGPADGQSQTRPHPAYPPAPPHPPVGPLDSQPRLSQTSGGYSQPVTNGADYAGAPMVDPYRQPGQAAAENRPAQPVPSGYSTPPPAAIPPAVSYLPPVGNGYPPDGGTNGYSTPTSATTSYPPVQPNSYHADSASYQAQLAGPTSAAFPADHDNGYRAIAPAAPGYSAPAAGYPTQPAEPPGYSSHPGVGQPPAAQPQSTGFAYAQPADPGLSGQPPAGQQTGSYVGYQPPVHTGQAGVYQLPASSMLPPQSVQPGYPSAQYGAAPYEPPAYPAPTAAYEADSGYPADPYAVDPYGYPGYGSARLSVTGWRGQPLGDQRWDARWWQERYTDDRPGAPQSGYQQYWEDDER